MLMPVVKERTSCPACDGAGTATFAFSKDAFDLFTCADCAFLFVHPFPTGAEIEAFYNANYRGAGADFYPKAASRSQRAFVRAFTFAPYVWRRSVLEIGCGGGFMLNALARFSSTAHGLDIGEASIAYARKHFPRQTFYCETMEAFRRRALSFDFVFSSELLEHLPGTRDFMETVVAVTHAGSLVYFSAPDAGHRAVPANVADWGDICPPEHLQFFNRRNVQRLFSRYGFRLKKVWEQTNPAHSLMFQRI